MRIRLLTGGGDSPGLDAVIRAGVRKAIDGHEVRLLDGVDVPRGASLDPESFARIVEVASGLVASAR